MAKPVTKPHPGVGVGVQLNSTEQLRTKLIAEITQLQRQLEALKPTGREQVDFSMIQTYKELIHSRQEMLSQLPRSF